MLYYGALTAFLASSLFANAYHNVTYNDNDPAIIYQPPQAWLDWPPAGCLSWPGGQYTLNPASSITLSFYGVAVYAYGLFDDSTNPIYTIQVDNAPATELGRGINANPQSCDPIYSKTGLQAGNHTIVFQMTDIRPDDVKDLSFQGFIVTVPDAQDTQTDSNDSKKTPIGLIAAGAGGGVALILIALATFCFCRSRRKKASNIPSHPMAGSAVPLVLGGYNQPPVADPSIPAPTPFILPPSRESSPYYPPSSTPWSPASSEQHPHYNGSNYGPSQAPCHASFTPSGGFSTPSPSNEGYGRPYGSPVTASVDARQSHYPNSPNPGFYGDAKQQQFSQGQGHYPNLGQPQTQGPWNSTLSASGYPQSEISHFSREEGSTSAARSTVVEQSHQPSPPVRHTKGAVDRNAAPVVRNENTELENLGPNRESRDGGGEAPPPEYGAF